MQQQELYHPYMKSLQGTLIEHYRRCECLTKRLVLMREGYSSKSEYEKNEIEIKAFDTRAELESLKKTIQFREDYFKKYIRQFAVNIEEMERNYDAVLAQANERREKDERLKNTMDNIVWSVVNENIEAKIKLYQILKKMMPEPQAQEPTKLKKVKP